MEHNKAVNTCRTATTEPTTRVHGGLCMAPLRRGFPAPSRPLGQHGWKHLVVCRGRRPNTHPLLHPALWVGGTGQAAKHAGLAGTGPEAGWVGCQSTSLGAVGQDE